MFHNIESVLLGIIPSERNVLLEKASEKKGNGSEAFYKSSVVPNEGKQWVNILRNFRSGKVFDSIDLRINSVNAISVD